MIDLKNEATRQIALAKQAVEAVRGVEAQMATNAVESRIITEALTTLTNLIERYRGEAIPRPVAESVNYE